MFTTKWDLGNDWTNSLVLFKDDKKFAQLSVLTGEEDKNGEWDELLVCVTSVVKFHENCREFNYEGAEGFEGVVYDYGIHRQPIPTEQTDEQMLRKACQLAFGFDPGPAP